jgi:hypothetical protein
MALRLLPKVARAQEGSTRRDVRRHDRNSALLSAEGNQPPPVLDSWMLCQVEVDSPKPKAQKDRPARLAIQGNYQPGPLHFRVAELSSTATHL